MIRRAIAGVTRSAVPGSYGVPGGSGGRWSVVRARLADGSPGIDVHVDGGRLSIALRLRVGWGVPVAEVGRRVESAVRHGIRRNLGREVDRLSIVVGGLAVVGSTILPARSDDPRAHDAPAATASGRPGGR